MAYVYRGTKTVEAELEPEDEPTPKPERVFDPAKCGTNAGYKQHQNHGVPSCQACRDASAAYQRELKIRRKTGPIVRDLPGNKCGTLAGYSRHKRRKTPVCAACKKARAEYRADYYERAAA